jgi:hypothetical protein
MPNVRVSTNFSSCCRSYLELLENREPLEISDDELEELGVQSAIQNSLTSQARLAQ